MQTWFSGCAMSPHFKEWNSLHSTNASGIHPGSSFHTGPWSLVVVVLY